LRIAAFFAGTFLVATTADAAPITVDHVDTSGRQWARVTELTNLSWNQLSAVCPQDGVTPCTGDIGTVETTGWVWATRDQVRDLFYDFGVPAGALAGYQYFESGSSWAPAATSAFSPTFAFAAATHVNGWTATLQNPGSAYAGLVIDLVNPAFGDEANLASSGFLTTSSDFVGAWLFRPAAPEPGTLVLLATGVAGIVRLRRRRR
jgi:hypothetical protein